MQILVSQPTGDKRGHYGLYTSKVCQALAAQGHQVTLCTNRIHAGPYLQAAPKFRVLQVGHGRLDFGSYDSALPHAPWRYYWGYLRNCHAVTTAAVQLCDREPFDVVMVLDTEFLVATLVLGRRRHRLPAVVMPVWASNFTFSAYAGSVWKRVYKVVQREIFRTVLGDPIRALVVLGDWHEERLRTQLRLPADFRVAVIPDGSDIQRDLPDQIAARHRLGLPAEVPIFLFFGVLRRDKGVENLVRAMALLTGTRAQLIIAGWPMEYRREEIETLVHGLGIAHALHLRLDYVPDEDVPWLFAACNAVVFPYTSAYTGGSGPLTKQAGTYGKPVIATNVSELGRIVAARQLGLLAAPDDPRSLAARLHEFLSLSEAEQERMRNNALALAADSSWDTVAAKFVNLFRQVAK